MQQISENFTLRVGEASSRRDEEFYAAVVLVTTLGAGAAGNVATIERGAGADARTHWSAGRGFRKFSAVGYSEYVSTAGPPLLQRSRRYPPKEPGSSTSQNPSTVRGRHRRVPLPPMKKAATASNARARVLMRTARPLQWHTAPSMMARTMVTGSDAYDAITIKRINDRTSEATLKKSGKVVSTARRAVSADGKMMTITITGTDAKGQKMKNTAVYEKQ